MRFDLLRLIILGDCYAVINCYGDIIASAPTRVETLDKLCTKYDYNAEDIASDLETDIIAECQYIMKDWSRVFYDHEQDKYITSDILLDEFNSDGDLLDKYNWKFLDYIRECCSKNGTLEEIPKNWEKLSREVNGI